LSRIKPISRIRLSGANQVFDKQQLEARITANPQQCGGRPGIRGMRIRVADILEMLAEDVTAAEILADFPDLESEDIQACLEVQ
jgi:uncharacterized protein (DUF433 family)